MSRIGKKIIKIEAGITVDITKTNLVTIKGPKGTLVKQFSDKLTINFADDKIQILPKVEGDKSCFPIYGTTNALISNMVHGVAQGFTKELMIVGVGYRAAIKGNNISLSLGYSHLIVLPIPKNLEVTLPKPTNIIIFGIDKEEVGHFAALIRSKRLPEPYLGKGILYKDEKIIRKEGKAAGK